jgi:hypothetical protein
MQSYVYIDVSTSNGNHLICYKKLPDASRCFNISMPRKTVNLTVVNCFLFGYIKFEGKLWTLEDKRTHCITNLPRRVLIGRDNVNVLKALLQAPSCDIGPVVVHSHELVRRVLNPVYSEDKIVSMLPDKSRSFV